VRFGEGGGWKGGLEGVGYRFVSVERNLGFTLITLFYLSKLLFISSNILLFFVK